MRARRCFICGQGEEQRGLGRIPPGSLPAGVGAKVRRGELGIQGSVLWSQFFSLHLTDL